MHNGPRRQQQTGPKKTGGRTGPDKNGTAEREGACSRAGSQPAAVGSPRLSDRLLEREVARDGQIGIRCSES